VTLPGFGDAAEIDKFTPTDGYNVVGVDSFEPVGEALYLVAHVYDAAEAERLRAEHAARSGNVTHVYGPKADR
jgi:hypothetical protein